MAEGSSKGSPGTGFRPRTLPILPSALDLSPWKNLDRQRQDQEGNSKRCTSQSPAYCVDQDLRSGREGQYPDSGSGKGETQRGGQTGLILAGHQRGNGNGSERNRPRPTEHPDKQDELPKKTCLRREQHAGSEQEEPQAEGPARPPAVK